MHQKKIATFLIIMGMFVSVPFILSFIPVPNYPIWLKENPFLVSVGCIAIFSFKVWSLYQDQKEELDKLERGL